MEAKKSFPISVNTEMYGGKKPCPISVNTEMYGGKKIIPNFRKYRNVWKEKKLFTQCPYIQKCKVVKNHAQFP